MSDPKLATDLAEVVEGAEAVVILEASWTGRGICPGIGGAVAG